MFYRVRRHMCETGWFFFLGVFSVDSTSTHYGVRKIKFPLALEIVGLAARLLQ